jgi:hypothetical protein
MVIWYKDVAMDGPIYPEKSMLSKLPEMVNTE